MTETAPDQELNGQNRDAPPEAGDRLAAAWQRCADALIDDAQACATAIIDETAATTRRRVAQALTGVPSLTPTATDALLLGASVGLVGAVLLVPRAHHA